MNQSRSTNEDDPAIQGARQKQNNINSKVKPYTQKNIKPVTRSPTQLETSALLVNRAVFVATKRKHTTTIIPNL
jgi:hypothetical protein